MSHSKRWASRDVIADDQRKREYPKVEAALGLKLTHRPSRTTGVIASFVAGQRVVLRDEAGQLHDLRPHPGVLLLEGKPIELIALEAPSDRSVQLTASGSIKAAPARSVTAQASRIWVEGVHDAELIERIWGDDLRVEGVVVEPLHGADALVERISSFRPGPHRRLGVLLDHLIAGSKESRIAAGVSDNNVLICGHPYVDVWQAIKPQTIGIEMWPRVPRGTPWKEGVVTALGSQHDPGEFWHQILDRVSSYRDVETPLVNSVEQLIDFVTAT
ncbi:MAG: DUF3097 family protein [Acidimicrobiia bacterium]|nr:DUF3097 family protein [Acidimicrobiia bacterium]